MMDHWGGNNWSGMNGFHYWDNWGGMNDWSGMISFYDWDNWGVVLDNSAKEKIID